MKTRLLATASISAILLMTNLSTTLADHHENDEAMAVEETAEAAVDVANEFENNPLLQAWDGPYGGVPAYDKFKLEDLKSALEAGMAKNREEVLAIANNPEPATFENTILALEDTGRDIGRVFTYWGIWSSNMSSPEFREIQGEMIPKLSAFFSELTQNEALFKRVQAVYEGEEYKALDPVEQRLVWLTYDGFASNGATLGNEAKARYAELNQRNAELQTQFANNVLADEEGYVLYIAEDQLSGLPDSFIQAAAAAATEREHEGEYAITNTRSSMSPFLTYSDERDLREQVWRTYVNRGDNGDEFDNNEIIKEILKVRDERVKLLGYNNYAEWQLQNRMAVKPENAYNLMETVWPAAIARVEEEVADMQALADSEGAGITIEPWDYRYYAEKVRQARYEIDSEEIKQYLQLGNLRDAMFMVAGELFNFEFTPVPEGSVPVYHEDMEVFEVTDKTSGEHIGLWYLDPFARAGKRSGAWANTYRSHETFKGKQTVLSSNNSNFVKGAEGEPVLISWDDAETLFHEFGHALHSLSSGVAYPTLNGAVWDSVEFQSQLLERWLTTDRVIDNYLVHVETGEPMPAELVAKIEAAANFNQGFTTTEYLASALVDMAYHTTDPTDIDPDTFEQETLEALGMPSEIVMRHRSTQFGHIFSVESYAAGYYGYMWADVLTSDAAEAFDEAPGGFYDADMAAKLEQFLFSSGNSMHPADAYRAFRGRDPEMEALMRDRGFPVPESEDEGEAETD